MPTYSKPLISLVSVRPCLCARVWAIRRQANVCMCQPSWQADYAQSIKIYLVIYNAKLGGVWPGLQLGSAGQVKNIGRSITFPWPCVLIALKINLMQEQDVRAPSINALLCLLEFTPLSAETLMALKLKSMLCAYTVWKHDLPLCVCVGEGREVTWNTIVSPFLFKGPILHPFSDFFMFYASLA